MRGASRWTGTAVFALSIAVSGIPARADGLSTAQLKEVRRAVNAYVRQQLDEDDGAFVVRDEKLDKDWRLKLIRLGDDVLQVSEKAYSIRADFKPLAGGSKVDVDFIVNRADPGWTVRQTIIRSVGGKPRAVSAAAASSLKKPEAGGALFVCPMGDYSGPKTSDGTCPKCGMKLVEKK